MKNNTYCTVPKTFNYIVIGVSFQNHFVCTNLDIYVFITYFNNQCLLRLQFYHSPFAICNVYLIQIYIINLYITGVTSGAGTAFPSGGPEFTPVFSEVPVTLDFCVCFVDRCLSFRTFSFGHGIFCPSSIYGFCPLVFFKLFFRHIHVIKIMNREHYTLNKGDVTVTYSMLNIRREVINAHSVNVIIFIR